MSANNSHAQVTRADAHAPGEVADYMDLAEQVAAPANPSTGFRRLFAQSDGIHDLGSDGTNTTHGTADGGGAGGITPGQVYSYPASFAGDTISGSSATPFADVVAFDTKEVLNSRILHLATAGASKDQRVRVTLGTAKAAAFDVTTAVAFDGRLWSSIMDAYLEVRGSTAADAQLFIARIGTSIFTATSTDSNYHNVVRVGGSAISSMNANAEVNAALGETFTLRFKRDGSNVIRFYVGVGTLPMALAEVRAGNNSVPFTATVAGTLARIEYAIHTPSGPSSSDRWDGFIDYLASI